MKFEIAILILMVLIVWFLINPVGRFGLHFFGFTVYSHIPLPYYDIKIHTDGSLSLRDEKSHNISFEDVADLVKENPEILIIGTGYSEMAKVDGSVKRMNISIETYETGLAIEKFNRYRAKGKRIAGIFHTTC